MQASEKVNQSESLICIPSPFSSRKKLGNSVGLRTENLTNSASGLNTNLLEKIYQENGLTLAIEKEPWIVHLNLLC